MRKEGIRGRGTRRNKRDERRRMREEKDNAII
jgi:hypothetical protein